MKTAFGGARLGRRGRVLTPGVPVLLFALTSCGGVQNDRAGDGETLTIAGSGASNPTVAWSDAAERGYVAWVGDPEGKFNVYLASVERDGLEISSPVRVNDIEGDAAPHEQAPAQIAVAPDGRIYVVWQNNTVIEGRRFPASDLRLSVSSDGGRTFALATTVNDDAGRTPSSHTFHDIAVGDDGTVFVSWIDGRAQEGAEGPADVLNGPEIRVARSTDGGSTFSASTVVDMNSCPCCRTAIAVGHDGRVHIAWRKLFPGGVRDIVVATAPAGSLVFEQPVKVRDDGWEFPGCPHAGPSLAVAPDGRLHVAWYTGKEGRQGLWHAVSDDGGRSFHGQAPLVTADWVPPSQARLGAGAAGVLATWEDRSAEVGRVWSGYIVGGQPPRAASSLATGRSPSIAAGGSGALVAWLDGEAVRARWLPMSGAASTRRAAESR